MNLIINSSPKQEHSVGLILAGRFSERLDGPTKTINIYDAQGEYFNFKYNQEWIDLLKSSQRIIIPVAMWNLGIPAALKDFWDKVIKKGELWTFDDKRHYIGLLPDRPTYIIMTSSAEYGPKSSDDFVIPYLRAVLSSIGIRQVHEFRVENIFDSRRMSQDNQFIEKQTEMMLMKFIEKNRN